MARREPLQRGDSAIWLAGSGLGICLLMIAGMIALILTQRPRLLLAGPLVQLTLKDGTVLLGEISGARADPAPGTPEHLKRFRAAAEARQPRPDRHRLPLDRRGRDRRRASTRATSLYVERREYGPFIGRAVALTDGDRADRRPAAKPCSRRCPRSSTKAAERSRRDPRRSSATSSARVNYRIEQARLDLRRARARGRANARRRHHRRAGPRSNSEVAALKEEYARLETAARRAWSTRRRASRVTLQAADGAEKELPALDLYRVYPANQLSTVAARAASTRAALWEFLGGDPRESNTEGGIFPAIFGTVMMVMLMSVLAVPFGVLAALYLREYAQAGRSSCALVRIAVNNLAGVPSIVFGVFGLGFFVYIVGGSDRPAVLSRRRLPTPTFGTGGILWASLTLGLLTVPVVIVAAEEALVGRAAVDARGVAGGRRDDVPDDHARRAAGGGARHPDRPDPGDGARRRRSGAADDHRRRQAGARPAARRVLPVRPSRAQVHAPGLSHLRRRLPEPERRGGQADGLRDRRSCCC